MNKETNSSSADRNKIPILEILKEYITYKPSRLLEIASGRGKHAVYFATYFQKLEWVTSELEKNHLPLATLLKKEKLKNIHGPITLKVGRDDFPKGTFDYVFSANTLHIMSWKDNKNLFKLLGKRLREGSLVFFYGPFNYDGNFTADSNKEFDKKLKVKNEKSGIRNFEDILNNMKKSGFKLLKDHEMPTNNRLLVFERLPFKSDLS